MTTRRELLKDGIGIGAILASHRAPAIVKSLIGGIQTQLDTNAPTYSAASYVQDGLVVQMDGIESITYGKSYAPQALATASIATSVYPRNLVEPNSYFQCVIRSNYGFDASMAKSTVEGWGRGLGYNGPQGWQLKDSTGIQEWVNGDRTWTVVVSTGDFGPASLFPIVGASTFGNVQNSLYICKDYYPGQESASIRIGNTRYTMTGQGVRDMFGNPSWWRNGKCSMPRTSISGTVDVTNLTMEVYVNGIHTKTVDLSTWNQSATTASIDFWFGYTGGGIGGETNSIRLYNRVLSVDEIWKDYQIDKERFGL